MHPRPHVSIALTFALTGLGISPGARSQPDAASAPQTPARSGSVQADPAKLPASVKLGVRVEAVRRQWPVVPVVVIVSDAGSYVRAIGAWRWPGTRGAATLEAAGRHGAAGRFPVLMDDGTWGAAEDIARFVRAFAPARVVRWKSEDASWPAGDAKTEGGASARWALIEAAAAEAWGAGSAKELPATWSEMHYSPVGAVVCDAGDPAWTAALALAAGRGQVLVPYERPSGMGDVNATMSLAQCDALSATIRRALEAGGPRDAGGNEKGADGGKGEVAQTGWAYRGLGDDIDSVTLCVNIPGKVAWPADAPAPPPQSQRRHPFYASAGESLATTDLVGRFPEANHDQRWAWCGQVFGSEARCAYAAMCSLFLQPDEALLFNGYEAREKPWSIYAHGEAAAALKQLGWRVTLDESSHVGADDFRDRAAGGWAQIGAAARRGRTVSEPGVGGVSAGLIAVNTSGMAESFDLKPGQCLSGDVPMLGVPALVSFVHSWSATSPGWRSTIAGRWLERGAYAYVGSVHEPFLTAFQPSAALVGRMLGPAPLGAAARLDGAPPWRVTIIGDPLMTLGTPAPRIAVPTAQAAGALGREFDVASDPAVQVAADLKAGRFAGAMRELVLSGRDKDAARLAAALVREQGAKVEQRAALAALGPVFRATDQDTLAALLEAVTSGNAGQAVSAEERAVVADLAWHSLGEAAPALSAREIGVLKRSLREGSYARDAERLAGIVRRASGDAAARAVLEDARRDATDAGTREQLGRLIESQNQAKDRAPPAGPR